MHVQNPFVTVASYSRREQKRIICVTVPVDQKFDSLVQVDGPLI